ncbi:MAG TPA: ABC transporter permease subunit [Anaerolineae bacterium]|nr:ABC transporter permease subunit [Anaerolineae bacterium]HOQ99094.1 ABC transporter permease subunit [Anaerolineae bacterium]HPL29454.1 ABC transporter permease subunit [Anaerolineae bacterium]
MGTIFRHTLSRMWAQVLGWGLSFAALGWFSVWGYGALAGQTAQMAELLKAYPPEVLAFFGSVEQMFTPGGYLDSVFLSYSGLLLGVLAILLGSGLLVSDEEAGRLDLIQAYPVSRTALFAGRVAALVVALVAVVALTWAGCALGLPGSRLGIGLGALALPFVSLLALLALAAGLALVLSMALPSRSLAATVAAIVLVAGYTVRSLARVNDGLAAVARLSPFNYFQSGYAVDGLNWAWCGGLLAVGAVFTVLAWWAYQRRDLRVAGEGSWRLPGMARGR